MGDIKESYVSGFPFYTFECQSIMEGNWDIYIPTLLFNLLILVVCFSCLLFLKINYSNRMNNYIDNAIIISSGMMTIIYLFMPNHLWKVNYWCSYVYLIFLAFVLAIKLSMGIFHVGKQKK